MKAILRVENDLSKCQQNGILIQLEDAFEIVLVYEPAYSENEFRNFIKQLRDKTRKINRIPSISDIEEDSSLADIKEFERAFGSYATACEAAGLPSLYKGILITQIQEKAKKLGRTPSAHDIESDKSMPSMGVYKRVFGSWSAACKLAGLKPNTHGTRPTTYTRKGLIAQLKAKAKELGRTPFVRELEDDKSMPSLTVFRKMFGSWSAACKAAGLKPNKSNGWLYTDSNMKSK